MVDRGNEDDGDLVDHLRHHYAASFGYPPQVVDTPPYARIHADNWTHNVLGLLVQKAILLPHAQLVIDAHDLRMWRHDYYPTSTARASNTWPSEHLKPNDRLRNPHIVELRKHNLREYHGLDLWKYYEVDEPTAPMPKSILDRTTNGANDGEFTEPGIVEVAAYSAVTETPSTSSQAEAAAYSTPAEVEAPPPASTNIVDQNPRVPDDQAAIDAGTTSVPPAATDAATPSPTDAPPLLLPQTTWQLQPPSPT